MESRILNTLLLPVLCFLTVTFSNAQIASSEVLTSKGYSLEFSNQSEIAIEEEMVERIKRGDLLNPIGASAFDIYKDYVEDDRSDASLEKKLKRFLVAALVEASDKALTEYFDEGGDFIHKYMSSPSQVGTKRNIPVDRYYITAADLLGEDHFLYGSLKAKGYFIEALKMRYIENKGTKEVKEKLEKSIALDPESSYTYNELGVIYFDEKNYTLARVNYNRAIKINAYWETPKENLRIAEEALKSSKN